ncbi:MAG: two-component regulator propeller domain-containing protein [Vicingaceae bacterium]
MRCSFVLLFSLLISVVGLSQTYHFDNYTVEDGLSQSTVYCIVQDNNGYLWLGNRSGISRFDGAEFINYTTKDGTAGNGVRCIYEDNFGTIWFGHVGGGLTIMRDEKFMEVKFDSASISSDITSITSDDSGRVWLSTAANGLFRITNPSKLPGEKIEAEHFIGKHGMSDRVFEIFKAANNDIYFITDVGIKRYIASSGEFETYAPENLSNFFQFTTIYIDKKGDAWYGTYNGGLYQQDAGSGEISIYDIRDGLANNWVSTISEDKEGRIWVGTWGGGISVIDDGSLLTFNQKNGLPDLKIFDITTDREGNVLIGSNETGLFVFKGEQFVAYTEENGVSSDQVWAVEQDKSGNIWLGTNNGITIMKGKDDHLEFKYLNEDNPRFISNDVRFIKKDLQGNMWVGTLGGVIKIDPALVNGPYEYSGRLNSNIKFQIVTAMDIDKYNNLWIGTLEGLIYYEINHGRMNHLTTYNGLAANEISEIHCDPDGAVWVGCKGKGLTLIRDTNFITIDLGGDITPNSITTDRQGNTWIGTDGQGLMISKDGKAITGTFTVEDGLVADLINVVKVDNENNIWIGTNKGLNKFDRKGSRFLTYTESDGFTGIETKSHAALLDKKKRLWFGTVNGAIRYDPSKDRKEQFLPIVQVTRLKVNLNDTRIEEKAEFTYKEKSFYFDFKGIYLTNPGSVRYKYILEGIDEKWSEPTTLTFANYPALPHGNYTFKVMASNNTGEWTPEDQIATYSFTITPPFWKTWWFYIICVIFIGSWIAFLIKKREENLQIEKKILEEKVEKRTAEVVEKNKELASKNKDITDSIRYAERIQRAILPPDTLIRTALPDSFVFYRPKDIVSGDFYWVETAEDLVLFSAIDCTGHGVPGAFMSIVGHNLLDKIVKEENIHKPSEILDHLNTSVSDTLRQTSETDTVKDGMDMALIALNYKELKMEYSGAHNAMYLIRDGELIETKADRFAIGSFIRGEKRKFTNHVFDLKKGDLIYVFSDGFPDQFGGKDGKKYKYKPFKEFLLSIIDKSMKEQHQMLEEEFINWLGSHSQIDDVIIIGVRV